MNPGNILSSILNGSMLQEIEEALLNAFPTKGKLERMLFYKLSVNLDNIALGENYTEIVFKVVKCYKSKNKLAELIDKAREENDGNPKLQEVANKINALTSLFEILIPLENKFINQIKQAYLACCPDNWHEDWEEEIPGTLKEILAKLQDMPQGNASQIPIIQFVARLLENAEISELTAKNLKKLGKQNTNNFSQLLTQINNAQVSTKEQQETIPTYLIVLIKPSIQYPKKGYSVAAWFIPDGRNDKFDFRRGTGYTPLEIPNQEKDTFNLKEVPIVLENFLKKINNDYMTDCSAPPIIVFFLPFKLLSEPVEHWKIKSLPIGTQYQVVIRSCGRLKDYGFRSVWIQKWQALQQQINNFDCYNIISGDCDWKTLFLKLSKSDTLGLKLAQPPSPEIMNVLDQTATPVAIWVRKSLRDINCQEQLDTLFKGGIAALPNIVREKRLEAFPIDDIEQHIGHHLSLLWEDPYLLPTHIDYVTP